MIKEKPILFNTEMSKAILEERKIQTRRLNGLKIINKNPDEWDLIDVSLNPEIVNLKTGNDFIKKGLIATFENNIHGECYCNVKLPYQVGQKLWLKQSFTITDYDKNDHTVCGHREDESVFVNIELITDEWSKFIKWKNKIGKKSKLFMFKSLAYIWLEVTDVRLEKIRNISLEDIRKEGLYFPKDCDGSIMRASWKALWDKINEKRGYSYESNCWVCVILFKRIKEN